MSAKYVPASDFEQLVGEVGVYKFGDEGLHHCFCKICGVAPFTLVASVPADYSGPARPGDRRVNLGCIDGLDPLALEISIINGKAL